MIVLPYMSTEEVPWESLGLEGSGGDGVDRHGSKMAKMFKNSKKFNSGCSSYKFFKNGKRTKSIIGVLV